MSSWQIHEYGGVDKLKLAHDVEVPVVKNPDDVLVEVYAASVSPIDVKNMGQSVYLCLWLCFSVCLLLVEPSVNVDIDCLSLNSEHQNC